MQEKQNRKSQSLTRVSDLTQYMLCPRLVYFTARGYEQPKIVAGKERRVIENILLKELGFNLKVVYDSCAAGGRNEDESLDKEGGGRGGDGEEKTGKEAVTSIIADIVASVEQIYINELETVESAVFDEVKSDFLRSIEETEWCNKLKDGDTTLAKLESVYGYEREHTIVSKKLEMVGSVDKLIQTREEVIPCMIKTGRCPEYSVWRSDKMQLAAYAMLLEEEFETRVLRGFVEYMRTAEIREVKIKKKDRALVIEILKRVKHIKEGLFPDKGENAPCDNCTFIELCDTKKAPTLLSKLFGK